MYKSGIRIQTVHLGVAKLGQVVRGRGLKKRHKMEKLVNQTAARIVTCDTALSTRPDPLSLSYLVNSDRLMVKPDTSDLIPVNAVTYGRYLLDRVSLTFINDRQFMGF
jgi:hypothetical protein